ncbi:mitochondrial carrier [Basidiobolus meristosporus CBS 931.73]|uniref:Mitochondrial carrier n=1 Tax=Basidiobolus meristosporus CBS 931.73 TaxID=1314790 RepID=A0A1Y1XTB7_9FUNG|nr:mitochondrial carrier [Basidiobolus meristosporus CBS 931.73]|eukprot:ORX88992.1 mitochondrial carrier [Basidiobolus meristosporus CBS 931.73]
MGPLENVRDKLRRSDNLRNSLAGAGAGCVASIVTCPLDVVKTKLQNQGRYDAGHYRGTFSTLKRIWAENGLRGWYRGLGPTIFGYLPTWAIYFTVYDYLKQELPLKIGDSQPLVHMISAMGAGAVSSTATNPLWVIKTRFMTQSSATSYHYNNTLHAFKTIWVEEGIHGFYKGLVPSLFGLLHVAVQFPLYEQLKIYLKPEDGNLPTSSILVASATSKMAASVATYPHEVIRTRLQNQTARPFRYAGIRHTITTIYLEEGWSAFYKGMPTNLLRTIPASALTILTYEVIARGLADL